MNKVPLVWRPLMLRLRWSPTEYSTKVQPPSHLWRRLNDRKRCGSMENACKHSLKSICLWSEIKSFCGPYFQFDLPNEYYNWINNTAMLSFFIFFIFRSFSSCLNCIWWLILETSLDLHQRVFETVVTIQQKYSPISIVSMNKKKTPAISIP